MAKAAFLALFVLSQMLSVPQAFCQAQKAQKEATGTVIEIDFAGSKLVARTADNNITFMVNENTKILMGSQEIGLADIEVGDTVTIKYTEEAGGKFNAISIIDNNLGNEM